MSPEESLRRQLRFAFVLQVAGAVMFAVAAIVRVTSFGLDALAIVFVVIALAMAGAAVFIRGKMRDLAQ